MTTARREIGVWTAIWIVVGNMIGSGIFLLPASLAPFGALSLAGWLISGAGSVLLALVFARLARLDPAAGGPYAYTRRIFGDFAAFSVAWGYWISIWVSLGALGVAFVGALEPFIAGTVLGGGSGRTAVAIGMVWLLTAVNLGGIGVAGRVQSVTAIAKVLPLATIGIAGLFAFAPAHFQRQIDGPPVFSSVLTVVTLTLWAFLGLESATIPAESVKDPERTIPRATIVGTIGVAVIYIIATVGVMSLVPPATLATTTAPFAEAARGLFGGAGAAAIAIFVAISAAGALNGWTLIAGQFPMAVARDGLFPAVFARTTSHGTPYAGMIIGAILTSIVIYLNLARGLVELYTFMITLSTLGSLVPYVTCSAASVLIALRESRRGDALKTGTVTIGVLACVYSLFAVFGAGGEVLLWGVVLCVIGVPGLSVAGAGETARDGMSDRPFGTLSETGAVTRFIVKHAAEAFLGADAIDEQWQDLNFTARAGLRPRRRRVRSFSRADREPGRGTPAASNGATTCRSTRSTCATRRWSRRTASCCAGWASRSGRPSRRRRAPRAATWGIPVAGAIAAPGLIEGGDVVWLDDRTVVVGRGYRTNDEGIRQFRAILGDAIDELIDGAAAALSRPDDVFHLMSILSPVDRDLAVVYSPLMPVPFRELLLARGITLVEVPDDEFESMGANVLAIAPRQCVMVAGNPRTRARLEVHGAHVLEYDGRRDQPQGRRRPDVPDAAAVAGMK